MKEKRDRHICSDAYAAVPVKWKQYIKGLFNELYFLADLLDLFIFALVILYLLLLEVVAALGIDRNDKRTELLYSAVPESLRHA